LGLFVARKSLSGQQLPRRYICVHITHYTPYIIHHTSYIIHHTSHITYHTSHIIHHTSYTYLHALIVCTVYSPSEFLIDVTLWIYFCTTHITQRIHTRTYTYTHIHTHTHTFTHIQHPAYSATIDSLPEGKVTALLCVPVLVDVSVDCRGKTETLGVLQMIMTGLTDGFSLSDERALCFICGFVGNYMRFFFVCSLIMVYCQILSILL